MRVVGDDGVTGVLGDDTDGDDNGEPPAVTLGPEEVEVAGAVVNIGLDAESLLDLAVLELDSQVVLVAVGVVLGQGLESLVVAVPGDEPSGGLWDDFGKRSAKCYEREGSVRDLHQMKQSWQAAGTAWRRVRVLHDQSLSTNWRP